MDAAKKKKPLCIPPQKLLTKKDMRDSARIVKTGKCVQFARKVFLYGSVKNIFN